MEAAQVFPVKDPAAWTFSPNRSVVATTLDDGRVIVTNFANRATCTLDAGGLGVWFQMGAGRSVKEIILDRCTGSTGPGDELRAVLEVASVLLELLDSEMIHPSRNSARTAQDVARTELGEYTWCRR